MNNEKIYQYLILGAGPAGVQMAYFLQKNKRDYIVLERSDHAGSFFSTFPRHGMLISINKKYTGKDDPEFNMRHDWNSLINDEKGLRLGDFTEDYFPRTESLVEYINKFAKQTELNIRYNANVTLVDRDNDMGTFTVTDANGDTYRCKNLLVATGLADPMIPDVPGIEHVTGYEEMEIDPAAFRNQSVLILGKGNSAFETADNLIANAALIHVLSPNPVRLAWETRFVGNLRAVNNNFIDTYTLKSQNAMIDASVIDIKKLDNGKLAVKWESLHANDTETIEYDHVIRCTGFRFNTDFFSEDCCPELTQCKKLPVMDSGFESSNVPNMFFMGSPTQYLDYRRSQSAFIHGFRYNILSLFQILEKRFNGKDQHHLTLENKPDSIALGILERMNRVSSLWQQVGFLADMIVVPEDRNEKARYYQDLPYQYALDNCRELAQGNRFFLAMYRIGTLPSNSLNHKRPTHLHEGKESVAIHPVYEQYDSEGKKINQFHLLEDLFADWSGAEYVKSAIGYFSSSMEGKDYCPEETAETRHIVRS